MKTAATTVLLSLLLMPLFAAADTGASSETPKLKNVRFIMTASDGDFSPPNHVRCIHENVLTTRKARNPANPPVVTLEVSLDNARDPDPEKLAACEKDFGNLTRLNEQKVRDDIGQILADMKCKPNSTVNISMSSFENNNLKGRYPGIRHNRVITELSINGCVDVLIPACSYPVAGESWNPNFSVVDYEKMMESFRLCKESVNKYVEDNNMLEKWAAEAAKKGAL